MRNIGDSPTIIGERAPDRASAEAPGAESSPTALLCCTAWLLPLVPTQKPRQEF